MFSIPVISAARVRAVASSATTRTLYQRSSWSCETPETELSFDCEERDFGDGGERVACLDGFAVDDVVVGDESCCWCHGVRMDDNGMVMCEEGIMQTTW